MRGYPNGPLTKRDYENLLAMPEHADRARADLVMAFLRKITNSPAKV